jgi:GNAT superfamily N-acetyltransferase
LTTLGYEPLHKLSAADSVEFFDCAHPALNQFLQRYALVNQKAGSAQTYVCCKDGEVVGFYSLAVGSVEREEAPQRVVKGLARHPVPVMILARLAVDKAHQGKGLGRALLKDALLRTLQVSDIVGIRALIVHAKNDVARQWYIEWEFEPSPTDPFHLFLILKDLKAIVEKNL